MNKLRWGIVGVAFLAIIIILVAYVYAVSANGPIEPVGRLGFVKLANPDMYPGHPHSELLAKYAEERNSKCAIVVHFGGSSNYRSYMEGDTYIIEMAFIDTQAAAGSHDQIQWLDSLKVAIFGIPDGRYKYKMDGKIFTSYDDAMAYANKLAKQHNQKGPIPMFWHGTVSKNSVMINQGCGYPLFFQIVAKEYGIIPAYYYTLKGMIYPYFSLPYRNFELQHASELQYYYNANMINYE